MTKYTSNAWWPDGTAAHTKGVTHDTHDSEEAARAVCRLLARSGFGGEGKVYPLATWVGEPPGGAGTAALAAIGKDGRRVVLVATDDDEASAIETLISNGVFRGYDVVGHIPGPGGRSADVYAPRDHTGLAMLTAVSAVASRGSREEFFADRGGFSAAVAAESEHLAELHAGGSSWGVRAVSSPTGAHLAVLRKVEK